VALNEELYFHFSQPLDRASINRGTVQVTDLAGEVVPGEFLTRDPRMVVFVPDLPTGADLLDGGFRPATRYRVTLAGFPRVDGIRATSGEILSQSLVFWFETASANEGESLFFGFPGGVSLLELDPQAHGRRAEMGTLDPIRLVVEQGVDPSTLHVDDFELQTEGGVPIDLRAEIVENARDRAVIELLPTSEAPRGEERPPLEPGRYVLGFSVEMRLRTLGGGLVSLGLRPRRDLRVRARQGRLEVEFTNKDLLFSGRPPKSDATARWGGEGGGVSVRYPRAAGEGRDGRVVLGAGAGPTRRVELPAGGLDVHATRLTVADGMTVELVGEGGLAVLRSQGPLVVRGLLKRTVSRASPPPELALERTVLPSRELEEYAELPPDRWPPLSTWLERARAADEVWTVLVAGGELEVDGQIDVEGHLLLVAGGEVRLRGSVVADKKRWQSPNCTLLQVPEHEVVPLTLDPPLENPLKEPLCFSVQSRDFGIPGGVSAWGTAYFEGSTGRGSRRISFYGQRLRGGILERWGPVNNMSSLEDCPEICFRIDLTIPASEGELWDPPRLDRLALTWSVPRVRPGNP